MLHMVQHICHSDFYFKWVCYNVEITKTQQNKTNFFSIPQNIQIQSSDDYRMPKSSSLNG